MADMDDSNFDDDFKNPDKQDGKEYDVQYQNWQDKAEGSRNQKLWSINGAGWLDVFSRDYDAVLQSDKATGGDAALYFGITGITNFLWALMTLIFFVIVPVAGDTFILFSWVFM